MGLFNTVYADLTCPSCKAQAKFAVQFKFGECWNYRYRVGDSIQWSGRRNDDGTRDYKRVVVDAEGEDCPRCGYRGDFPCEVFIEEDRIVDVKASEQYRFLGTDGYIVLEAKSEA